MYILNAAMIGSIWALMRQRTGSIMVTSVCHRVWNGCLDRRLSCRVPGVDEAIERMAQWLRSKLGLAAMPYMQERATNMHPLQH
jgi:membrane protease YdiL (CAAX protease family)